MSIEAELAAFIAEEVAVVRRNEVVSTEEPLVSSGRIDSMGLLQVLAYVQERYGVDLLARGDPRDFDSVKGLAEAVRRERGAVREGVAQVP